MKPINEKQIFWTYCGVGAVLVLVAVLLQWSDWQGSTQLHTLMELAATLTALFVGVVALVRFYSRKNNTYLFIGVGFIGTSLLDGYHAVVTSELINYVMPSPPPSLIPWSWNASRTFLSILMALSWWAWRREQRLGEVGRIREPAVYAVVIGLTVLSFCVFALLPLPRAYYPELIFGRPEEFVSALFFLVALVGYLNKGEWLHDSFEHWVILSLIVGLTAQAVAMSRSYALFDAMFDMAHTLKIVSYVCVLIGLISSMYQLFVQAEHSEQQTRIIIEAAPSGMIMVRDDGTIVFVNSTVHKLFGYEADELIGQPVEVLLPERLRSKHPALRDSFFHRPEFRAMGANNELFAVRKDGSEVPVEIGLSPVETADGLCALASVVDITERKRHRDELTQYAADLERSNTELDEFAYVASHDLRSPLDAIKNLAAWIGEDNAEILPDASRRHLEQMQGRLNRLERLLEDLLHYSRAGRMRGDVAMVDTTELVKETVELLGLPSAFQISVSSDMPTLRTARVPLEQVLRNLINNAVKHHDRDRGTIEVTCRDAGEQYEFSVTDDGPGIAAEFHEQIFKLFETLRPRDEVEGSGMGLSVIRKIVENYGGHVAVESNGERGTTFRFTWPKVMESK